MTRLASINSRLAAFLANPPPSFLPLLLVLIGIALRLTQYFWNISYFHDEICLLWNISRRDASQFLGALDNHQAAPPLFLCLQRMVFLRLGDSEMAMRLLPLMAGCLAIITFAMLARKILTPWGAILALFIFICSDQLSFYASTLKPYSLDVFLAIVLTMIALRIKNSPSMESASWILLCLLSAAALWLCYPASLLFAGLSLALLPIFIRRKARDMAIYIAGNLLVGVSFLVLMHYVAVQRSQFMSDYWDAQFIQLSRPLQVPGRVLAGLFRIANSGWKPGGLLILPCAIIGGIHLWRTERKMELGLLVGPLVMNLCAAAAHRYPFDGGRLTLYLIPSIYILAAMGAVAFYHWSVRRNGEMYRAIAGVLPAAILVSLASWVAISNALSPRLYTNYRPLVAFVRAHAQGDDIVYSSFATEFRFYWPTIGSRIRLAMDYADQIPAKRFWIAWSNPQPSDRARLEKMRAWARTFAVEREAYDRSDNCAYLFEVTTALPPHTVVNFKGK